MALSCIQLADNLGKKLEKMLQNVPDRFLDTFEYTATGKNLTHPIVLGYLSRLFWDYPGVQFVGIDVRLNSGEGTKFQPDLAAFGKKLHPLFFLDYESPNSSDARIPGKDVDAYSAWREKTSATAPYVIVTTLPDAESPAWELRWTSRDQYNEAFRGRGSEVVQNPYQFWYTHYRSEFASRQMENVAMLNISGKRVRRIIPEKT